MNDFWKSPLYSVVQSMKATGNRAGIIARWKEDMRIWAEMNVAHPDAKAVLAFLPLWQDRPFYTADELAPLFPALTLIIGRTERMQPIMSANRLANMLKFAGLPFREVNGKTYFLVEQIHVWRDAPLSALQEILNVPS